MKLQNGRLMVIRQLDKKLQANKVLTGLDAPSSGWVNILRKALNMSLRQLAQRLKMSAQGVKDLEKREADESISLKSLREAGKALNMKLVYGFVPFDISLEDMVEKRAYEIAMKIVKRTSVTMALEDQGNTSERLKLAVEEMTQDIKKEMPKNLWD